MDNLVKSFIGLVAICTTEACVDHTLPQRPTLATVASQEAYNGGYDGEDKYRAINMTSDRFMVFWTIDYGYRLNPDNDLGTIIIPEFESEDTLKVFNLFFSNENIGQRIGKRTYCDCVGERYERDGAIFYKIHEAHLFAK